jgi:nondiscriminating glutamyl-tRNA synthetase
MSSHVRVRFAPSPTGMLHLGNVRTALFTYLFARQKNGTFILRIEDTDAARNVTGAVQKIIDDLNWLGMVHDEGPVKGGANGPYLQSERQNTYKEKLAELIEAGKAYRCFCSAEDLEKKRKRQQALKQPPRYDRTCMNLSSDMVKARAAQGMPFIWRQALNHEGIVEFIDLARGTMTFGLDNFSDPPLTRADGSFTFMFANFVDDWLMEISHVIRGEDHLSNTAVQAAMFQEFALPIPTFWHLPFLCNREGKKLSKRDFGFSLDDLRGAGFLPEAILNYLAITGSSFANEVQTVEELACNYSFDNMHSTGAIRYDVDKLTWMNNQWIRRISTADFASRVRPLLEAAYPSAKTVDEEKLLFCLSKVQPEMRQLGDVVTELLFIFDEPTVLPSAIIEKVGRPVAVIVKELIAHHIDKLGEKELFLDALKRDARQKDIKLGELFRVVRYALTGVFNGIGMNDLFAMLDHDVLLRRLRAIL